MLTKQQRLATGVTLREYCLRNGLDPIAQSRFERGVTGPLSDAELLGKLPALVPPGRDVDRLVEAVRNS